RAAGAISAWLLGCGASTPPPEAPEPEIAEPVPAEPEPPSEEAAPEEAPPAPGVKSIGDGSIPDDYEMLRGDCVQLGRQLAALTRADQLALLSPKLTAAQRAQADKNITDVANRIGDKWITGCEESLVGKVVDRKSLQCGMEARTVKAFDECLNAQSPQEK
ncbi:MAG TPA: hypothetical protein VLS89_14785, partial [Candidatus Nanopelagicales bacterium]|nr:hypothetical protein [Candidatus Nanopelagicales bacterium]